MSEVTPGTPAAPVAFALIDYLLFSVKYKDFAKGESWRRSFFDAFTRQAARKPRDKMAVP